MPSGHHSKPQATTRETGQMPELRVTPDDHRLATALAIETGRLLVDLRDRLVEDGASQERIRLEGDRRAHEYLTTGLATRAPRDAVLSEEEPDARGDASAARLAAPRTWIVDPLDGTREYGDHRRADWAVHVALVVDHEPLAAAVALPAQKLVLSTDPPPAPLPPGPAAPRVAVSRSRPPAFVEPLAEALNGVLVPMGSAGAKAMAIVLGAADAYVHDGGQWEWDSAAPVGVARAAGLHCSRLDGTALHYNADNPYLPDLLICRPELAAVTIQALGDLRE